MTDIVKMIELQLEQMELRFARACHQVVLLNGRLEENKRRYQRADAGDNKPVRYNIRIKLCVMEGVRDMYYEYARRLGDQLTILRIQAGHDPTVASTTGSTTA